MTPNLQALLAGPLPEADYAARREQLVQTLGNTTLLVSRPCHVFYLTGFEGEGFLLINKQQTLLFTDSRYSQEAGQVSGVQPQVVTGAATPDQALPFVRGTLALEGDALPARDYVALQQAAGQQGVALCLAGNQLATMRQYKSPAEAARIARACALTDEGFLAIMPTVEEGLSERQIAATLLYQLQMRGAQRGSFDFIVAAGPNGSMPHAQPTQACPQPGQLVTMDFGCVYNGYCSDLTRTVAFGRPDDRMRRLYELVARAQQAALACIRPGLPLAGAHNAACAVFEQAGMLPYFTHGLGHGVGLEIHEAPRVNARAQGVFEPGMVVTCEPGLYLPGVGGVRIEDVCLLTQDGMLQLSQAPKGLPGD